MDLGSSILGACIVLAALFLIIGIIYAVWSSTRVKKQKGYYEDIHKTLSVGQRVMFSDGIYGTVRKVGTDVCDIEVKSGTVMEVSRYAIQQIVKK